MKQLNGGVATKVAFVIVYAFGAAEELPPLPLSFFFLREVPPPLRVAAELYVFSIPPCGKPICLGTSAAMMLLWVPFAPFFLEPL